MDCQLTTESLLEGSRRISEFDHVLSGGHIVTVCNSMLHNVLILLSNRASDYVYLCTYGIYAPDFLFIYNKMSNE